MTPRMIVCPVCGAPNHHLAIICRSCGGFVQSKTDTIDLFSTMWRLMEAPGSAFHRIAIATHKNYMFLLACVAGIGFAFGAMWLVKAGNSDLSLLHLLVAGMVAGPLSGIGALLILAGIQRMVALVFRLPVRFRNILAITAFSAVPIVFSVVFVLPIEILTFGKFMFSTNPSPAVLRPISYFILLGLDGACLLWSAALYVIGVRVLYDVRMPKAVLLTGLTLAMFGGLVAAGVTALSPEERNPGHPLFTRQIAGRNVWNG